MEIISKISLEKFEIDYGSQFVKLPKIELERSDFPTQIVGANGCGKSSLILTLAGVIPNYISGKPDVKFNLFSGYNLISFPDNQNLFRIIPQNWKHGILGFYPTEEIELIDSDEPNWKRKVLETLEINRLNKISSIYLSDGEKKRILISKALCGNPSLIISDEWTTHLDDYWLNKSQELFDQYFTKGGLHFEFHSSSKSEHQIIIDNKRTITDSLQTKLTDYSFIVESIDLCYTKEDINFSSNINYFGNGHKKSINVNFRSGELIILLGNNGSGKTTLIRNLWKDSFFFFRKIFKNNFKMPKILYIPTDPIYHILGPTVENEYKRIIGDKALLPAKSFFEKLLGVNVNNDVLGLSYGQRKMFAITLGIISKYQIICIDEPFAGLDSRNQKHIQEIINIALTFGKVILISDQNNKCFLNSNIYNV